MRKAKDEWFKRKAQEAKKEKFGRKEVWQCIRDLQRGRRGRMPTRVVAVDDEDGRSCTTTTEQQERWKRHFSKVLNVPSQFDEAQLQKVKQRQTDEEIGKPPTKNEVRRTLGKLRNSKAPGSSNILPVMVKAGRCNEQFLEMAWDVVTSVWHERTVPKEWVNAIIVPIPKKGNLRSCDN